MNASRTVTKKKHVHVPTFVWCAGLPLFTIAAKHSIQVRAEQSIQVRFNIVIQDL